MDTMLRLTYDHLETIYTWSGEKFSTTWKVYIVILNSVLLGKFILQTGGQGRPTAPSPIKAFWVWLESNLPSAQLWVHVPFHVLRLRLRSTTLKAWVQWGLKRRHELRNWLILKREGWRKLLLAFYSLVERRATNPQVPLTYLNL